MNTSVWRVVELIRQSGWHRLAFALLVGCALLAHGHCRAAKTAELPDEAAGSWQVESVLVDLGSGRRLEYQRDDPRLLGKIFTITPLQIKSDAPEARDCLDAKVSIWITTARTLVAKTLAPHGFPASVATPMDYELPLSPNDQVRVNSVLCGEGHFGPRPLKGARSLAGPKDVGTWIVILPDGRLAIRWYDQSILLLRRVSH